MLMKFCRNKPWYIDTNMCSAVGTHLLRFLVRMSEQLGRVKLIYAYFFSDITTSNNNRGGSWSLFALTQRVWGWAWRNVWMVWTWRLISVLAASISWATSTAEQASQRKFAKTELTMIDGLTRVGKLASNTTLLVQGTTWYTRPNLEKTFLWKSEINKR